MDELGRAFVPLSAALEICLRTAHGVRNDRPEPDPRLHANVTAIVDGARLDA